MMAVATDEQNRYLISGDSKGDVVVWNIAKYCNLKTFREVVNQVKQPYLSFINLAGIILRWPIYQNKHFELKFGHNSIYKEMAFA